MVSVPLANVLHVQNANGRLRRLGSHFPAVLYSAASAQHEALQGPLLLNEPKPIAAGEN